MNHSVKTLDRLFNPKSIAVVGATQDESKMGWNMMDSLKNFPGLLYPINPKAQEILGFKAYPNLKAVGRQIDLIILGIPARFTLNTIIEAGQVGAGGVLISSGGFGENDEAGKVMQEEILAACRQYSIRALGPNTAGFVNPRAGIAATFVPMSARFKLGHVGLISQSGAMNLVLSSIVHTEGMGISIAAGTGNAMDIGVPEMIRYLSLDDNTRSIAVYLEGVEDGRDLYDAIYEASQKKPVVIFTVGSGDIGEFALSHTGKMIGSFALKKAALIQAGAVLVSTVADLIDATNALSKVRLKPKKNPGVGVVSGQAGPAMVMTDYLRSRSVNIPQLSQATIEKIAKLLPLKTYMKNPVDTARPSPDSFLEVLSLMAGEESIDILLAFQIHEPKALDPVPLFRVVRERTEKPLILGIAGLTDEIAPTLTDMDAMGVPAFASPGRAAVAAWAITEDSKATYRKGRNGPSPESQPFIEKLGASPDEAQAKSLLKKINIATPVFAVCESHEEAIESFRKMKKPCVVKVLSPAITHKTEVGGVHLNIETDERLIDALEKIDAINAPGEKKYLLEEMAPDGLEIIIGAKNDVSFGPSVMAGLGGTAAEALGDTSIRIAPLDLSEALEMIAELRSAPLFDGWRGGPWYDKNAVAELLVKVGHFMVQHPEIKEVDLNPVRVYEKGVMVLDALMVCKQQ